MIDNPHYGLSLVLAISDLGEVSAPNTMYWDRFRDVVLEVSTLLKNGVVLSFDDIGDIGLADCFLAGVHMEPVELVG